MTQELFDDKECYTLARAVCFQFLSFEGSYKRVVNKDIAYAAALAERCKLLGELYYKLTGFKLVTESDSLHSYMYPEDVCATT